MVLRGLFYMHKAAFFNSIKVYEIYDILCHTMAEIEYIICIGKHKQKTKGVMYEYTVCNSDLT